MKKQWKKAVSIGCAACMLASTMPVSGLHLIAEAQELETQSDEAATSGTWGTCTWELKDGVLTISGGVGESLGYNGAPWESINKDIQKVNITGNITFDKDEISLSCLFLGCRKMTEMQGLENIDTSRVTNMSYMFERCSGLTELDLSGFDTSQVTSMEGMFAYCTDLKTLDLSGFDTSQVKSMYAMFAHCTTLKILDLSSFDINQAYIQDLFLANNLTDITIPEILDENVQFLQVLAEGTEMGKWKDITDDISYEFRPDSLTGGHHYVWVDGGVTVSGIWGNCVWEWENGILTIHGGVAESVDRCPWNLKETPLREMDIQKVEITGNITFDEDEVNLGLFSYCMRLREIKGLDKIDTSKVTDMSYLFTECQNLKKIDMKKWDIAKLKKMYLSLGFGNTFGGCSIDAFTLPEKLGDNETKEMYVKELGYGLANGSWCDVTAGVDYEATDAIVFEAGHKYIRKEAYEKKEDTITGVSIKKDDESLFDTDMELTVSDVTANEDYANYIEVVNKLGDSSKLFDIALEKDGTVIQPDGMVLVSIPLPDGMSETAKVYRIAEDGTATDMNAVFSGGYLTFATDHFSVYAVVNENTVLGDVNGDGIFNMADAALVRRYVANLNVTINTSVADVNKDGKIDMVDYALMRRALANWDVELK